MEVGQGSDPHRNAAKFSLRFCGGTCSRRIPFEPLQQRFENDAGARSRICAPRARTNGAPSHAHISSHSYNSSVDDLVYTADRIAPVLGEALAAGGEVARQSNGFRRDVRVRNPELHLSGTDIYRRVALPHPSSVGFAHCFRRCPHSFTDAVANRRASLRHRLLSCGTGARGRSMCEDACCVPT